LHRASLKHGRFFRRGADADQLMAMPIAGWTGRPLRGAHHCFGVRWCDYFRSARQQSQESTISGLLLTAFMYSQATVGLLSRGKSRPAISARRVVVLKYGPKGPAYLRQGLSPAWDKTASMGGSGREPGARCAARARFPAIRSAANHQHAAYSSARYFFARSSGAGAISSFGSSAFDARDRCLER
jgi:hypothetical protein